MNTSLCILKTSWELFSNRTTDPRIKDINNYLFLSQAGHVKYHIKVDD